MSRRTKILVVSALWTVAVLAGLSLLVHGALLPRIGGTAPSSTAAVAGRPAMMLVGDSITAGKSGDYTWRYRLYRHLRATGVQPDFVGPYDELADADRRSSRDYADPDFDTDHDAIWGRRLGEARTAIAAEVTEARPDHVLMLMGINDLLNGADAALVETYLRDFVANARSARPSVAIILGQILPTARNADDPAFGQLIADYNRRVDVVAAELTTNASPVVVARTATDVSAADDLYDGLHPNARGEAKIARGFANALAERFAIGRPMPPPIVTVPAT